MKAVLLVGGAGTRMRPLTFAVPKPLLAVGGRPILQHILERLHGSGFTEAIMATGYLAELIAAFCGDGSRFGLKIRYVTEPRPLGTAGPVSLCRAFIDDDEFFLLMNGDILTDLDFGALVEFARGNDFDLTVAYVHHTYKSPFGVLQVEGDEVLTVVEKPETTFPISAGIYVLKATVLDLIPPDTYFTVPDLMEALRAKGRKVGAYRIEGMWRGLESLDHIAEADAQLEARPPEFPSR
jgi:NDP-sugar pyrophosphorylase family protein